jgi:EAL domain-containing protein (putative c-di-GMP-specific phosphodiesterase class I)
MNILVIDDDAFVLKLLKHQLAKIGYPDVTVYQAAEAALLALISKAEPVDLVFCDIQMPEMDGVELIRHIAGENYQGGLVLMSGEDERILNSVRNLAQAHGLQVLAALQKPATLEQLQWILDQQKSLTAAGLLPAKKIYTAGEIRRAIRGGELINHYQPKVSLRTGECTGVEVLVRWQHPQDGLVFPDQFIAVAEEHDLIDELTRVVLVTALQQCRTWQRENLFLGIAVNISMSNLVAVDYPDFIVQAAGDAGVDLANLVLEVTESQLMYNPLTALDILTRLRLKNITLSIDDFGTGHSSLTQLRDIPFDELKIDAGFVHDACRNTSRRVILEASLDMARSLGMKSVAEGVENLEDWRFLVRQAQCDIAQGYFIGKPMPAIELTAWIQQWDARRQNLVNLEP